MIPSATQFRPAVISARSKLEEGRRKLAEQHRRGVLGVQVSASLTSLLDEVVVDLFHAAMEDLGDASAEALRSKVALVAHGGYGRRHLAPYSDVDLMILHDAGSEAEVAALAQRILQDIFDVGLTLGQSVRTPQSACQLAKADPIIFSSLVESRYLAGSETILRKFTTRFQKLAQRHFPRLYTALVEARREERIRYGETSYLLEPNIKRSRGALRDIQLLRWIGFARFGAAAPDRLHLVGALSRDDRQVLLNATEFMLRLRNEMHFHSQTGKDVLDRAEQMRIAEAFGYRGGESIRPVEQFMRDYFEHTGKVRYLVSRFLESVRPRPAVVQALAPLFSHQVEGDYRVGPREISATHRGTTKLEGSLAEVLRLMDLANLYNARIAHSTWATIYRTAPKFSGSIDAEIANRFMSLLSQPARLGELLRRLHELGVLEKILPDFRRARYLLQFNQYHKYTVDEHCIRAVEHATNFAHHEGTLGRVYCNLKRKRTLHLALLLHDLGKGLPGDHSEVGKRIAEETTARLNLSQRESEAVKFLVHKHLRMSHLAFRRDTSDDRAVVQLAVEVGSPELLQMLYVMSCADLAAVGPGVLNDWKVEVLTDLYDRALGHLGGDPSQGAYLSETRRREEVQRLLPPAGEDPWYERIVGALPVSLLLAHPAEETASILTRLRDLAPNDAMAWGVYRPPSQTSEYIVGVGAEVSRGVFHRLAGELTGQGMQILSAEINTLPNGLILDRFVVQDPDYLGEPPALRFDDLSRALVAAVHSTEPPKFRRLFGKSNSPSEQPLSAMSDQVRIDNSTSTTCTIIDVFTFDRIGLLYKITRLLFEMGLSVSVAKISTYLDQVVDVFYVTDEAGEKIEDEARLNEIRQRLLEAVQSK